MYKKLLLALTLFLAFLISTPAFSNYVMVPPSEKYLIMIDQWTLNPGVSGTYENLNLTVKGTNYIWSINIFALADRVDSNSICTGSYKTKMQEYLKNIATTTPQPRLLLEVCRFKKEDKEVYLSGIYPFNLETSWTKGKEFGSRLLELSPEKVRALGTRENYMKFVKTHCDRDTDKLVASITALK